MSKKKQYLLFLILMVLSSQVFSDSFKILEVNSYSSDWLWIQQQHSGFVKGMEGVDVDIRVVDLDSKNRSDEEVDRLVRDAESLIETWKPDLIYLTDDRAQSEVAVPQLNKKIPLVFSGVNKGLSDYGFDKAQNVTGVLEIEHFRSTLNLLTNVLNEDDLNVAFIIDDDPTWNGVSERIKQNFRTEGGFRIHSWAKPSTFEEYKEVIADLHGEVDAIGLLGVFRFKGEDGEFVDYEEVLKWTAENSEIPDFSFWDSRVERGTLCVVTVSGYEQGLLAGEMARKILVDRVLPVEIEPEPSAKGEPMISLARARDLELKIKSTLLLNSQVVTDYAWEK
ncbi:MAG: ABC transporter substrate binding protein [Spirochaetales bacterium]|nr:ABC transporter substrate binding protein [Spirochaetales bacterium]